MHFVLSYDLGIEAGTRRSEIEKKIISCLPENAYTRQLNNFYIVRVENGSQWKTILNSITKISKEIPETLHFIMTPPSMERSIKYNGMLPTGSWKVINELTIL